MNLKADGAMSIHDATTTTDENDEDQSYILFQSRTVQSREQEARFAEVSQKNTSRKNSK